MKLYSIPLNLILLLFVIFSAQANNSKKELTFSIKDIVLNTSNASPDIQDVSVDTLKYAVHDGNIGAGGYDLVNYFTGNSAEKGKPKFTANYDGIEYRFLSEENKKLFTQNPTKYLPAYGGWCSMNMAMGRATIPTYNNFLIIDDQLQLFEKTLSVNGKLLWQIDPADNSKIASHNYEEYVDTGHIGDN